MKREEYNKLPYLIRNSIRIRLQNMYLTLLENRVRCIVDIPKHEELIPLMDSYMKLNIN